MPPITLITGWFIPYYASQDPKEERFIPIMPPRTLGEEEDTLYTHSGTMEERYTTLYMPSSTLPGTPLHPPAACRTAAAGPVRES